MKPNSKAKAKVKTTPRAKAKLGWTQCSSKGHATIYYPSEDNCPYCSFKEGADNRDQYLRRRLQDAIAQSQKAVSDLGALRAALEVVLRNSL